jgi:hypothetical protein
MFFYNPHNIHNNSKSKNNLRNFLTNCLKFVILCELFLQLHTPSFRASNQNFRDIILEKYLPRKLKKFENYPENNVLVLPIESLI